MAIKVFSDEKRGEVFESFLNESLFEYIYERTFLLENNDIGYTRVEMWDDAKILVKEILNSKKPVLRYSLSLDKFRKSLDSFYTDSRGSKFSVDGYERSISPDTALLIYNQVMLCVHAIMLYYYHFTKSDALSNFKLRDICNVLEALDNGDIVYDYDYVMDEPRSQCDESTLIWDDPHNKVRLEILRKLFIAAGVDFDNCHGSQAAAARLTLYICNPKKNITEDFAKKYYSYGECPADEHKDEKDFVNKELKKMGLGDKIQV
ncbi:MAG: hypothetical protein KBT39_05470 [Bacteroidales bacterium]|nr:hypothetical protein [Bacteroidales bacterium]